MVRGGRDRDEQRAARAARAQGARPAGGGARRHVDHRGAGAAPRPRLGPPDRGGDLGRVPLALADASRDGLRPARGAPRAPVAMPRRRAPGVALPPRAAVGRSRRGAARAVQRRRGKAALRGARRRLPDPAHDRAAPRVLQHGRAVEPVQLAAPPRRVPRPLARGRRASRGLRGRGRARVVAARRGRGAGADRPVPSGGAGVHDLPLPRRGRREPAHHRRHRPEVRHRGVQGRRDPRREAGAGARSACTRRWTHGRLLPPDGSQARSPRRADRERADGAERRPRARPAPAGRAAPARPASTATLLPAVTRRARAATCCFPRCGRSRSASAGSAPAG